MPDTADVTSSPHTMSHFPPYGGETGNRVAVPGRFALLVFLVALTLVAACIAWTGTAAAGPASTRQVFSAGQIVPIPAAIPHEEGDMVDSRILPNLRWIAARYPIFVTDGYSGSLSGVGHVGCDNCHVKGSDHYNGLAVDIVALNGSGKCDAGWTGITRLALWAEPAQGEPAPPFRWVGYDGDAGHGCGHHLHLSWEHAVAPQFQLAEWVEVFPVGPAAARHPRPERAASKPKGPVGGALPPAGPPGGISTARSGGLAPGD